ncbi:hypothetical protein [Sediminibacillus massiliensis]|uniref:hypothetical protein n=1 Tax=Sediminibacillus massiliensis TaxID=1926277 RepID=UPI001FE54742|nr:hypothetical protein [Sediminibacillus massiliensis]
MPVEQQDEKRRDSLVRSKWALLISVIIFGICMALYFPFPNNPTLESTTTFMSFPIQNQDGYILLGIVGSVLFLIAMILLVVGLKKYHVRSIILVAIGYAGLPGMLTLMYQETLAGGIDSISYYNNGDCNFEYVREDLLNGECSLVLHNRSNQEVTFELEFLDSYMGEGVRMESLMNVAGPYIITMEGNSKKSIHLEKSLDVAEVPNHIEGGTSSDVHIKISHGGKTRKM